MERTSLQHINGYTSKKPSYSPFLLLCRVSYDSYGMDNHFSNLRLVHFLLNHLWMFALKLQCVFEQMVLPKDVIFVHVYVLFLFSTLSFTIAMNTNSK